MLKGTGGFITVSNAVFTATTTTTFTENGSYYTSCNSLTGGAIYFMGATSISLTSAHFITNTATLGGAIYVYYSGAYSAIKSINVDISLTIFSSNYATKNGGGIYIFQEKL